MPAGFDGDGKADITRPQLHRDRHEPLICKPVQKAFGLKYNWLLEVKSEAALLSEESYVQKYYSN